MEMIIEHMTLRWHPKRWCMVPELVARLAGTGISERIPGGSARSEIYIRTGLAVLIVRVVQVTRGVVIVLKPERLTSVSIVCFSERRE